MRFRLVLKNSQKGTLNLKSDTKMGKILSGVTLKGQNDLESQKITIPSDLLAQTTPYTIYHMYILALLFLRGG